MSTEACARGRRAPRSRCRQPSPSRDPPSAHRQSADAPLGSTNPQQQVPRTERPRVPRPTACRCRTQSRRTRVGLRATSSSAQTRRRSAAAPPRGPRSTRCASSHYLAAPRAVRCPPPRRPWRASGGPLRGAPTQDTRVRSPTPSAGVRATALRPARPPVDLRSSSLLPFSAAGRLRSSSFHARPPSRGRDRADGVRDSLTRVLRSRVHHRETTHQCPALTTPRCHRHPPTKIDPKSDTQRTCIVPEFTSRRNTISRPRSRALSRRPRGAR